MKLSTTFTIAAAALGVDAWGYGGSKYGNEFGAGVPASCSQLPPHFKLVNQTYVLPDPFHFANGKPVRNKADWSCRAAQLREIFQKYELGYKATKPPIFSSTYSNHTLNIVAGVSASNTVNLCVYLRP